MREPSTKTEMLYTAKDSPSAAHGGQDTACVRRMRINRGAIQIDEYPSALKGTHMQVRTRKNSITLIRTVYDPSIKRGRSVHLGTLPRTATSAPDDILRALTADERTWLDAWLNVNAQHLRRQNAARFAQDLPTMLDDIASWYCMQRKNPELAALAKASRDNWTKVLAAMSHAGVGRTRKQQRQKTLAQSDSNQKAS